MPGKRPRRRLLIVSGTAALAARPRARAQLAAWPLASIRLMVPIAAMRSMRGPAIPGPAVLAQPVVDRPGRETPAEMSGNPRVRAAAFARSVAEEVAHGAPIVPASGATPG